MIYTPYIILFLIFSRTKVNFVVYIYIHIYNIYTHTHVSVCGAGWLAGWLVEMAFVVSLHKW